jgi:hypothetical protein
MRVVLVLSLLLAACGDPQHSRQFPRWEASLAQNLEWRGCAGARAFVRKSGKQGIGVTLELRSRQDCPVTIARLELAFSDGSRAPGVLPPLDGLHGRSLVYLWVPIYFDGDHYWNREVRSGELQIDLAIDGAVQPTVTVPLTELWTGWFQAP